MVGQENDLLEFKKYLPENFYLEKEKDYIFLSFRAGKNGRIYSNGMYFSDRFLNKYFIKLCLREIMNFLEYKMFVGKIPDNFFELVEKRDKLRIEKKFEEADEIKNMLKEYGVILIDGVKYKKWEITAN